MRSWLAEFQPNARAWLATAACVGLGQQIFVVLRNQYLSDLGYSPIAISAVQASGGAAGLAAGMLGLWMTRALRLRTTLALGVVSNAVGFALQVGASTPVEFVIGAALAGLGIQGITMAAAPFLSRHSSTAERVRLFTFNALAIQTLPGIAGALLGGEGQRMAARAAHSVLTGYRTALAMAALAVFVGLLPLLRIREAPPAESTKWHQALSLRQPRRAAALLLPDALVFFGNGLTIPFLQLYFKGRFGLSPASIGGLYAIMMAAGSIGHLLSPHFARRFGTDRVILGTQLLSLPFLGTLLIARTVPIAAAAFVLRQAIMSASAPLFASLLHTRVVPEDSAPVAAHRMLVQSAVWAAAGFLAGPLMTLDGGGFRAIIAGTTLAYVAGIVAGIVVFRRVRGVAA